MPKGSMSRSGTKKTLKYRPLYDPQLYLAEKRAAKSPRGGPGMENPFKALKRRAAARAKKK